MLPAAKVLPFSAPIGSHPLIGAGIVLRGWSIRNADPATAATMVIVDGSRASGTEIATVDLLPSESTREWFTGDGIEVLSGLFVVTSGADLEGSFYYSAGKLVAGLLFVDGALATWDGVL